MIRTIIIDDEPLAIESLAILLKQHCDDVQVVGTSNSPKLGQRLIEKENPDLVFIDVEMPGMSGMEVIRQFENPSFKVVFVTAFDTYAIDAFQLSAIDYLLKPVAVEEIQRVIAKIRMADHKDKDMLKSRLEQLEKLLYNNIPPPTSTIAIAMAEKIVFVAISEILYCKAEGAYSHVFLQGGKKIIASKSLGEFEDQLTAQHFFRIHHSTLVNLKHIREFQRNNGGYVIMADQAKLEVSHRKRADFLDAIDRLFL